MLRGLNASTSSGNNTMAAFRQEMLRNLLLGLRARGTAAACSLGAMSLPERKRAVKRSADVAMAAARGGRARWAKAILAATSSGTGGSSCKVGRSRSKRVVMRRCVHKKRIGAACLAAANAAASSDVVARRLVRGRAMALRRVIPGGHAAVDEASLLREAMDYVVHLRAQVDVLRRVSEAVQRSALLHRESWPQMALKDREASSSMDQ